jgi:hypothetical protein
MKVRYVLNGIEGDNAVYWYYPEGETEKSKGVILYSLSKKDIKMVKAAENDVEEVIPPDDINEMIYVINLQKQCMGRTDFIKYENEPIHSFLYADQAMTGILNRIESGKMPKTGTKKWK